MCWFADGSAPVPSRTPAGLNRRAASGTGMSFSADPASSGASPNLSLAAAAAPAVPWLEADRLAALARYAVLDTPREAVFDDMVQMIAELLQVPMAAVNLVAFGRQWFKAELGLGVREMPLDDSICAHAILQAGGLVVPDMTRDPRFDCNALVTGEPGLRFYAGELLLTPDGLPLGTLCVLDTKPRPQGLTGKQHFYLRTLARQVMDQLELRRSNAALSALLAAQAEALRGSEQRARLALAAVGGIGTWHWDAQRDRLCADPASAELAGCPPEAAAAGIRIAEFFANAEPDDRRRIETTHAQALRSGGDFAVGYRVMAAGGCRWVSSRGHAVLDASGRPERLLAVTIDVTDQRALEQQLLQVQKMEAVGQLTGGLAHDFNNLLTGITGSLSLLRTRLAQGRMAEAERYIAAAQGAATRAAAVTHRLLSFSRRQTLAPKPLDANHLVAGMTELIRRSIGPRVMLEVVGAAGLWTVLCDTHQLENALLNLCINARDAMPDGGRLTIATANCWLDARAATERGLPPGQYVSLSVTDSGVGMPPSVAARAFDPFFTTKPTGQGTGLGLSMVYGFLRQSGGQARIDSEPGNGTTVRLYLPRHDGAPAADRPNVVMSLPPASAGERVLVVDDEPTVRMLVVDVLQDLGYAVLEAADAPEALGLLGTGHDVALLITDVGLPGLNGRQLADAARAMWPALKVLFITGYAENVALGNGRLPPGLHVMTKPFDVDALALRVRAILEAEAAPPLTPPA